MEVTGDQPSYLLMALDHFAERSSIGCRQADLVPRRYAGDKRWMVHREQRWLLRRRGQLGVEPVEPLGVQRTRILAGSRRVEHDEPQRAEIDRILHRLAVGARHAEVAMEGAAVVVVARQHVQRRPEGSEQLAHLLVFGIGGVVREIAGDEHRIRPWPHRADRLDRRGESRHG